MYFFTVVFDIKYVAIADMIKTIELETKQFQVSVWGKIYNSLKNSQCVKYIPNVNPPSLQMNLYVESFIVSFSNSLFVRIKIETLMNKFEIEQYAIILSIEMPKAKSINTSIQPEHIRIIGNNLPTSNLRRYAPTNIYPKYP